MKQNMITKFLVGLLFAVLTTATNAQTVLTVKQGGTGVGTLTGLAVGNGTSAFSAYAGTSCTNQFVRSLSAVGTATCATVGTNDIASSITLTTPVINSAAHVGGTWVADATWTLPAFTLGGTVTLNGQTFSGAMTHQNVRYRGNATYKYSAMGAGGGTISGSGSKDIATITHTDNYSTAIVEVRGGGMGTSGANSYVRATRVAFVAGGNTTFTGLGTDNINGLTIAFTSLGGNAYKITLTDTTTQNQGIGYEVSVAGGGDDANTGLGIDSLVMN